jgi:hypothetical protein
MHVRDEVTVRACWELIKKTLEEVNKRGERERGEELEMLACANYEAMVGERKREMAGWMGGEEQRGGGRGSTRHVGQRPAMTWRSAPLTGSVRPRPAGRPR